MQLALVVSLLLLNPFAAAPPAFDPAATSLVAACSGCGCKGGPGYRGPNGKCVGWKDLARICGKPPTTRCTPEHVNARR